MIPNRTLDHLRRIAEEPDLAATRYELEREIGRGGMGVVYQVRDRELERRVALKVIDNGEILEEARVIAQLEHPGIIPIYDSGCLPDGRSWYAMKLVEGGRLDDFLNGNRPLPERLRVYRKICDAVAFAHSRHVIHRDIKPRNIMVGKFGEVLVMDWGVAKPRGALASAAGTRAYMAPEQARGSHVDFRTDIFSLGVVLQQMIQPNSPRPLAAIAAKSMAANPAERYPDVESLSADVTRFVDGFPVAAYRENPFERAARFSSRNRTLLLLVLTYAAVRFLLFFLR